MSYRHGVYLNKTNCSIIFLNKITVLVKPILYKQDNYISIFLETIKVIGQKDLKTTERYTHASAKQIKNIQSTLDKVNWD